MRVSESAPLGRSCRACGCTCRSACWHDGWGTCWWVGPDLCSHCAMGLADVERPDRGRGGDR
ncbi:hypothetical protein [Tautonia plasticadhaerens]|uniref:Uncharacterized protein n=1 Tax=Tautonia plasticadhaerens TaxID=2527974 RepID=A0A518GZJ6_9BACT|nr:hypothetical protein [Tautonia plasticadhaerens]QDV34002.1 hypothetical protein ElP_18830 [Tautonia plasticadhaerens]